MARRIVGVEDGLCLDVGHRPAEVHERCSQLAERPERGHPVVRRAREHAEDRRERGAVERRVEGVERRDVPEHRDRADVAGRVRGHELLVPAQHVVRGRERVEDVREGHLRPDRVEAELEGRHDPEVPAAATQAPQQLGSLGRARPDDAPVGEHDLGADHVVGAQPVPASQPAHAAAEGEATDPGIADDAARRRESERLGGRVELAPGDATTDRGGAADRIDLDPVDRGQVDDEAVVDVRQAGDVVAAPANCDGQVALAREADRRGHVDGRAGSDDQRRAGIDHAVPDAAGLVVLGVGRLGDGAGDERAQRSGRIACGRCEGHGAGLPLTVIRDDGQPDTGGADH